MDADDVDAIRRSVGRADLESVAARVVRDALAGSAAAARPAELEDAVEEILLAARRARRRLTVEVISSVARAGIESGAEFRDEGLPDPAISVARGAVAAARDGVPRALLARCVLAGSVRGARTEGLDLIEIVQETATGLVSGTLEQWRATPALRLRRLAKQVITQSIREADAVGIETGMAASAAFAGASAGARAHSGAGAILDLEGWAVDGVTIVQFADRCRHGNVLVRGRCQYPPCQD